MKEKPTQRKGMVVQQRGQSSKRREAVLGRGEDQCLRKEEGCLEFEGCSESRNLGIYCERSESRKERAAGNVRPREVQKGGILGRGGIEFIRYEGRRSESVKG